MADIFLSVVPEIFACRIQDVMNLGWVMAFQHKKFFDVLFMKFCRLLSVLKNVALNTNICICQNIRIKIALNSNICINRSIKMLITLNPNSWLCWTQKGHLLWDIINILRTLALPTTKQL